MSKETMSVKPILFNAQMVRAILDGRKTMTRRVAKDFPGGAYVAEPNEDGTFAVAFGGCAYTADDFPVFSDGWEWVEPPYKSGDILWVRETWDCIPASPGGHLRPNGRYYYKADGDSRPEGWQGKWRPSIYMPKTAARIFLRVTDVRAEWVQCITDDDAIAEGASYANGRKVGAEEKLRRTAIDSFRELWDSINAEKGYGWDKNPWVWMISFERCEKPEGWCSE